MKKLFILFFIPLSIFAKSPDLTYNDLNSPPPKIIRTCCSFGVDLRLRALPFVTFTDITAHSLLGKHKFLGSEAENNGIIYTERGGFIDIAHLRDLSDWTGFMYKLIKKTQDSGRSNFNLNLGYEGGNKKLVLTLPKGLTDENAILLAGKIAYDLSVWHEIATWYGNSYIPLVPERYSAFSVEDAYSNLMGVHVGMEAIRSELPYEEAVTKILDQKLIDLIPVGSFEETTKAMQDVKELWWTDKEYLPSGKVLLKREFIVYSENLYPRQLPKRGVHNPQALFIPYYTKEGRDLQDLYAIEIKLNLRFPYRKIFGDTLKSESKKPSRVITQRNFQDLIAHGTAKNRKKYPVEDYQF
jgi:hypothetical protein